MGGKRASEKRIDWGGRRPGARKTGWLKKPKSVLKWIGQEVSRGLEVKRRSEGCGG